MVVAVPDSTALPVSGLELVARAALLFGAVSLVLIETAGVDRTNVRLASVVAPWPVLVAWVFVVLLRNQGDPVPSGPVADVFRFLVGPVGDRFVYAGSFGLAGATAYGLSRAAEHWTRSGWPPD